MASIEIQVERQEPACVQDLGRLDEAIASYQRALDLNPNYAHAHNNLATALRDLGKLDEAIAEYRAALRVREDYPEAHNNLGFALKDQGQLDEAIAKTIPTGPGQRNDRVFVFVRRLKAIAGLDTGYEAMRSYIREWHRRALPFIRTKDFQLTEETFFNAWRDAKTPLADDKILVAGVIDRRGVMGTDAPAVPAWRRYLQVVRELVQQRDAEAIARRGKRFVRSLPKRLLAKLRPSR